MSAINPAGGGAAGVRDIIALRQQIIDKSQVLQQLKSPEVEGAVGSSPLPTGGFADSLRSALESVNETQAKATTLAEGYQKGEVTDVAQVMLARQESSLAFEATLQVRNRLLSAYQDIMRMGV